jgi:VWFA-related protein
MNRRALAFCAFLGVLAVIARLGAWPVPTAGPQQAAAAPQAQQQPAFRSGIIVVPIDVHVIDNRTGKAVSDLKQEDFTLLEDGVAQPIRLFEKHAFTPETPAPGAKIPIRESAFGAPAQTNRVFLIVLGRGKHNLSTSRPLDALQHFVRDQLLPQDQAAVFAYDRATDFTTDHEEIARLIERFQKVHYEIDMDVRLQVESGLAGLYGSRALPTKVQDKIDILFQGTGAVASRELGRGETAATRRADADSQLAAGDHQRADVNQKSLDMAAADKANMGVNTPGGLGGWSSLDEVTSQMFTSLTLDDFMQNNAQSLQDLGNCYAGIEYLRHLEGEKHMIFVTERGMSLPRVEDDTDLAAAANDARVAIHTFQTGGIMGQQGGQVQSAQNFTEAFAFKALRTIAELSGGTSSIAEQGIVAVDRINDVTRNDYVLGYYPSMARLDGSYRKIDVKVKRPDSTVVFRHGYYARRDVGSFNRRDFITNQRMQAAASFSREIKDLKLKLNASLEPNPSGGHQLVVTLGIDPTKLAITVENGKRVGSVDILVVAADERGNVLGQHYQRANIDLAEDVYQKVLKSGGIPYNARIESNPGVRNVRVIVYDYKADLVGRADARVF